MSNTNVTEIEEQGNFKLVDDNSFVENTNNTETSFIEEQQDQRTQETIPTYIPELKEKYNVEVDEDNLKRFSDYKTAFEQYEQVKPLLDDEEIKQIIDLKKQGGTINDFIEATQIDTSKYSDEDLLKMKIKAELQEKGIKDDIELLTNAQFKKLYINTQKEIDDRIAEIDEELELGEDDTLLEEKAQLMLKKHEINHAKDEIIQAQKKSLEDKKINLLNKHKESQSFEQEMEAKIDTFKQEFTQKLDGLDTKLNFNDGKASFDLDKKELLSVSENIVLQETMPDGQTPFLWVKGYDATELAKAISVYKNLDTIISDATTKKELELDALYNNRQVPNLKHRHIDSNSVGGFRLIN